MLNIKSHNKKRIDRILGLAAFYKISVYHKNHHKHHNLEMVRLFTPFNDVNGLRVCTKK